MNDAWVTADVDTAHIRRWLEVTSPLTTIARSKVAALCDEVDRLRRLHATIARTLTRENFYEVGEWSGAFECWGLSAPLPELRWINEHGIQARAHLGSTIVVIRQGAEDPS